VDQLQPSLANRVDQQIEGLVHTAGPGQIVARREDVAGVEADAQLGVGVEGLEVRSEVPGAGAERGALAGRRLQEEERVVVVGQLVQQRQQAVAHLPQGDGPLPAAGGAPGVHDHTQGADLPPPPQ
jgi:hypothetical protein